MILSVAFVGYIIVRVRITPALAPNTALVEYHGFERFKPFFMYVLPLVSIFGVVVGAMTAGWGTPTESAAVGAFATVLLAMAYRVLTPSIMMQSLKGTVAISAMILFIIVGATTFSQILSFSGASNGMAQTITGAGLPPWAVIAGMMLILIFLGIFVDQVSMMMITLPIFMPVVTSLNVDLVWFGVMFLICMQLGLLLPPHGLLLMTMKGVAPREVTMLHIFQAVVPYVLMSIILLALVFFVPAVATWLPALIG
jgi:tripartite ATP-independent transporter DctM subunit